MPPLLFAPGELSLDIAERSRARRLAANLTQEGLSARAGITLGSLKRFERTGEVSLERLLRIASALGATDEFQALFPPRDARTLDEVLEAKKPQRARGRRQ